MVSCRAIAGAPVPARMPQGQGRPFALARAYARRLGLPTKDAWITWAHSPARPADIPLRPEVYYRRQGWVSWYDWLGTPAPAQRWRSFPQARAYAQSLHLSSPAAWRAQSRAGRRPPDIPSNPDKVYQGQGWRGWSDWLGTGRQRPRPFADARAYAHTLRLPSALRWQAWAATSARPADIPMRPAEAYRRQGWQGWADWLGPSYRGGQRGARFRSFVAARAYARTVGLRTAEEWYRWAATSARPADIPAHPARTYRDAGWAGFPDWLGSAPQGDRRAGPRPAATTPPAHAGPGLS